MYDALACVASVSNRVIARKLERKQKKVCSPPPPPSFIFFCSCPSFLDEPREETLATQANDAQDWFSENYRNKLSDYLIVSSNLLLTFRKK